MKKRISKMFDQGFIAVCVGICTSPLLVFALFFGMIWVFWVWFAMIAIVFLLGGIFDLNY